MQRNHRSRTGTNELCSENYQHQHSVALQHSEALEGMGTYPSAAAVFLMNWESSIVTLPPLMMFRPPALVEAVLPMNTHRANLMTLSYVHSRNWNVDRPISALQSE